VLIHHVSSCFAPPSLCIITIWFKRFIVLSDFHERNPPVQKTLLCISIARKLLRVYTPKRGDFKAFYPALLQCLHFPFSIFFLYLNLLFVSPAAIPPPPNNYCIFPNIYPYSVQGKNFVLVKECNEFLSCYACCMSKKSELIFIVNSLNKKNY